MSKVFSKGLSRFFATMLVVVMVLSMLPLNAIVVFAATAEHTDAVTITVKDDNGDPLPGVTVSYHIDSELNGADYKTGSVVTDEFGCVEVLAKDDFAADDLTLSATASLADYTYADGSGAITNSAITSDDQDFSIQMKTTKITGITVTATSVTYDGEEHDAATVTGTKQGDVITFKLGENPEQSEMPTIKEPDNYTLVVMVQREGFDDFVTTVYPSVAKATIELNVQEYSAAFDNNEHPALTVSGLMATDTVTYSLNGGEASAEIPTIINAGDYSVAVHVERHGYNDFDHTYNNIHVIATTIDGLSASSYQGTYDGEYHDAVTVSGTVDGDIVEYKLGEDGTWAEDVPQIKNAGNYTVFVRVARTNYEITNVDVLPANAYIAKADQALTFNNFTGAGSEIELTGTLPFSQAYDFSATDSGNLVEGSSITYSVELSEEDAYESEEAIAEIDAATGLLKVYYPGTIVVKATLSGDDNYSDCTISYELKVTGKVASNGQYISFENATIEYMIGANSGVASTQQAKKANSRIRGTITYSMATTAGLQINSSSGIITVSDYTALAEAIRNANGTLSVVVTANKAASMSYAADTATYVLSIKFADTPEDPYSIAGTIGGADNWYNSPVTATPAAGYRIAKVEPINFDSTVSFDDQGQGVRYVYLQDASEGEHNGEITDRIAVNVKIDTVAPSTGTMKITYSTAVREEVLSLITFGYYNPTVTVTFEAADETSGLSHLKWTYTREAGASVANLDQDSGELTFDDEGKAYLTLTGEEAKQYRGNLSFTATDNAGNTSAEKTDTDHVVVIDTIAPNCVISYTDPLNEIAEGERNKRFFDGDVTLKITVTENNFYAEDFVLKVSKDGAEAETVSPTWNPAEDADNVFIGTYTLTGDGDYIVYAEYKDRSNNSGTINDAASYESDILTIDTTDPQISFTFNEEDQTITVTVVEHNFRREDITATVNARDRNNVAVDANDLTAELQGAEWTKDEDTYSYTTGNFVNGIYTIQLEYTDLANHSASFTGDDFVIDHGEPSDPTITYSTSLRDTVVGVITLGFYNPDVTITFTAYDEYSEIDHFVWSYARQEGASETNVATYEAEPIAAIQDAADSTKFTATITLPKNEADQLRGSISVTAYDSYGQSSNTVTDTGRVIIVDTIAPTMTVAYSDASNTVDSVSYYGLDKEGQAKVTFTVTEANFFAEDVVVKLSKGGTDTDISGDVVWNDTSVDVHVGTYTITDEGDYFVKVEYKDRSNNEMASYTSNQITIDTTKAVLDFAYDKDTQKTTFTVTEHYFRASDISVATVAKDITNAAVTANDLDAILKGAEWTKSGDTYTFEYDGYVDAYYDLTISYTDMAKNVSDNCTPETFIIDHTKPTTPTIAYSTSLKDTLLGALTLGFYNPSVDVTFTAYDLTSGVDYFTWSYTRDEGVSETNVASYAPTTVAATQDSADASKFTATITLPKEEAEQLRGFIEVSATDKYANLMSDSYTDEGTHSIIVDTIAPTMTVAYSDASNTVDSVSYYGLDKEGQAKVTFTVTEANFFAEDVVVKLSKGGTDTDISGDVVWNDTSVDVHVGTYTITGEGDYFVKVEYKDRSNNEMASYTSNQITIDTTKAVLDFAYDKDTQKTTFTVTEHYFRASDISVATVAKDITNAAVTANDLDAILKGAEWTKSGDTYTFEYDGYVDAYYDLTISYTDMAKNVSDNCTPETFIIDHTKPTTPTITYSTPLKETVLSAVTLGFYNPTVEITFTAYDQTAGIDYFTWEYTRENNVSETNVASYAPTNVAAKPDSSDSSKFTATITLPKEAADQLRGYISVTATDTYSNTSNRKDDSGKIVVVDTVSPTMEVAYSEYSNLVGTTMYYGSDKNGQVEVTLTVTEANFFSEDVIVKVAKNGGEAERVSPAWTDVNADKHTGKFTISGDGHYIVTVDYTDRSTNKMTSYESAMITLDTVKPVIAVEYQNTNVINSLADRDGNQRDYFDRVQTAVVTVTEHNFNADDVQFSIVATDVTGADLNAGSLTSRTAWSSDGDVHKITITYAGDANYTFDVDYMDLATNAADDYAPDYFTVDTIAPAVTSVTYSTSVLDTVLSSVSFGFYNAKMTVTITATDDTAGVHRFDYSYLTAAGVSSVNAQLLDQAIEEASITYSNGGRIATMSFDIPKMVLGNDDQFNGTVTFDAVDRSNNKVEQSETKRVVVDNISPTATVTYNDPVNSENGISYYDGDINGTITITEANFYSDDVLVMVSANGGAAQVLPTTWSDTSVDVHVGQFTLTDDANYIVTVNYRDKSNNAMAEYVSNQLTIDTAIEAPVFTINDMPQLGDFGGAYNGDAEVAFSFEDQNFDSYTITLTRTMLADTVDVTGELVEEEIAEYGGTGTFTIPEIVENDGIYILRISIADKVNHTAESYVRFSINRFGSTYDLTPVKDIINRYLQEEQDIVFTEINVNMLDRDSISIRLTKNGTPVDLVEGQDYTIVEIYNDGKWSQYEYTINKELFADDGTYSIAIYSVDAAGNVNENIDEAKNAEIAFGIDKTNPVVIPVDFESGKQYAVELKTVSVEIKDNLVLEAVRVLLNEEEIEYQVDGETYTFDVPESNGLQTVRIIAVDAAGNETEVLVEDFLVSTNFFVRWFNNTPLFIGTVGGVGALGIGATAFALARKKKKIAVK